VLDQHHAGAVDFATKSKAVEGKTDFGHLGVGEARALFGGFQKKPAILREEHMFAAFAHIC